MFVLEAPSKLLLLTQSLVQSGPRSNSKCQEYAASQFNDEDY